MKLHCARCGREYPRSEFAVITPDKYILADGRPAVMVRHKRCGYRWSWPAQAAVGRDSGRMALSR